ncbi:2-C-methyl-D-erythritol 4-phosphate cytidylyltransferase [Ruminococcus sp. RTP21484sp1_RTP21281st1_A2_RTP21281_210402]|uniref:IspD/TarI family cytidylyltransferase n=1 Tax=unclassified Ruminococcus TaxID=2608920 RepID=UPI0034A1F70F
MKNLNSEEKEMNIAVIFAGGIGTRMHSRELPKQFLLMHGKPIIAHTIDVFQQSDEIDAIVIACVADWIDHLKSILEQYNYTKVKKVVPGGDTGQASIYNGLKAAKLIAGDEKCIVLIHDGVRPLINNITIHDNIRSVIQYGSGITCVKAKETVLEVNCSGEIINIPDRNDSRLARAPQSFWLNDILTCHENAIKEKKYNFIDSCSMMKYYGKTLHLVEGPDINIKVTTPEDFYVMRAMLDEKENGQIYGINGENYGN